MRCTNQKNIPMELKEIAKELMVHAENAALITVDSLGVSHVRAMDPFYQKIILRFGWEQTRRAQKFPKLKKTTWYHFTILTKKVLAI